MATPTNNKLRGKQLEREVVKAAQAMGLQAKRAWGSNGQALGHHEEVDVLLEGRKIQCKRRKRLPAWLIPNENVDVQVVREDHGQPFAVISLHQYLTMIRNCHAADPVQLPLPGNEQAPAHPQA